MKLTNHNKKTFVEISKELDFLLQIAKDARKELALQDLILEELRRKIEATADGFEHAQGKMDKLS